MIGFFPASWLALSLTDGDIHKAESKPEPQTQTHSHDGHPPDGSSLGLLTPVQHFEFGPYYTGYQKIVASPVEGLPAFLFRFQPS